LKNSDMNTVLRAIQKLVLNLKTEELFVRLRRKSNAVRKIIPVSWRHKFRSFGSFIPHSSQYPKNDRYTLTRDHTRFIINRSDYVQWRVFYGVRDNALLKAKRHLIKGGIVLDIGASFGAFSLKLAAYIKEKGIADVQIHAFEPNPVVYDNYKTNLELNPDLKNIVTHYPIGLGNESAEKPFDYTDSNTGAGRVVKDREGRQKITIERLDDVVRNMNGQNICFIKLIAGGFEPEVINGGWRTISKYKPPIFIEVTPHWWQEHNATAEDVLDKFKQLGYEFTIEHFNEMLPYDPKKYFERTQFNLFATCKR
jgi:FkbM family methyltransferase